MNDLDYLQDKVDRLTAALHVAETAVLELRAHLERPLFDQTDADWIEALADYDAAKEAQK